MEKGHIHLMLLMNYWNTIKDHIHRMLPRNYLTTIIDTTSLVARPNPHPKQSPTAIRLENPLSRGAECNILICFVTFIKNYDLTGTSSTQAFLCGSRFHQRAVTLHKLSLLYIILYSSSRLLNPIWVKNIRSTCERM